MSNLNPSSFTRPVRFMRFCRGDRSLKARRCKSFALLAATTLSSGLYVAPSVAQELAQPNNAAARIEAEALFAHLLVKPNDLDAAFRYSALEAGLGDQEAAIGGLERMLFYNPNLPRVRLELGLLYFQLGSYEMARSNFEAAIASPDTPDDVRARVSGFLKEIDRRVAGNQFSVFGSAGLRYQSNANAGPSSQLVRALGNDAVLSNQYLHKPDWNAFGSLQMRHVYDFQNQRGDVWETNATAYYSGQFTLKQLNLGVLQVDTGPRLAIGSGLGLSIRPYAIAAFVPLANRPYLSSPGAGVSLRWQSLSGLAVEPGVEVYSRRFYNSHWYPNATDQTGSQVTAYLGASSPLPNMVDWRVQGRAYYTWDSARYAPYAYRQAGLDASVSHEFESPVKLQSGRRWTFTAFGGLSDTKYKAADYVVDPLVIRRDRLWRVGGALDMPIYEWFGIAAVISYTRNASNISNFAYRNFAVSFAPTVRF